jgi:hypothetical protein
MFPKGKETEHNWAARDQAIQRVRGMLKGDVHIRYSEPFLAALKDGFISWSTKTVRNNNMHIEPHSNNYLISACKFANDRGGQYLPAIL